MCRACYGHTQSEMSRIAPGYGMNEEYVFVVDDDADIRDSMRLLLEVAGFKVRNYTSAQTISATMTLPKQGCLIADIRMPDMSGLELQEEVAKRHLDLPVIIMTGHGDVPACSAGDEGRRRRFPGKTLRRRENAGQRAPGARNRLACAQPQGRSQSGENLLASLTPRERGVLDKLVQGRSNKVVAYELGISPRTGGDPPRPHHGQDGCLQPFGPGACGAGGRTGLQRPRLNSRRGEAVPRCSSSQACISSPASRQAWLISLISR